MSGDPIVRLQRTRTEDRRKAVLETAWLHNLQAPAWHSPADELFVEAGQPFVTTGSDEVVLLMLKRGTSAALEHAAELGHSGARVYVLAEQEWTPAGTALKSVKRLLVRRLAEVPASGLVVGDTAALWCGKASAWRLALTPAQATAFRQIFLRIFWHDAVDEAWSTDGRFKFTPAQVRPFDVPEIAIDACVRRVPAGETLRAHHSHTHALLNAGLPGDASLRRLWMPPSGLQTGRLRHLLDAGCSVTWDECGLPDTTTDGRTGALLLAGKGMRLRLELSTDQAAAALRVLDGPAAWSLLAGLEIGAFAGKQVQFWLPAAAGPSALSKEQRIEVSTLHPAELRDVPCAAPSTWPSPSALALNVTYTWDVIPPAVPNGAQDDPLVGQWRNVDRGWEKRLGVVSNALMSTSGVRASIGQAFKRLMSALMGFERAESRLWTELKALEAERPSAVGPVGASRLLDQLGRLEDDIGKLHDDLERAQRKAREDVERERQRAEWEATVTAAKRELPAKAAQLAATRADEEQLQSQLEAVEAGLAEEEDKAAKKDLKARRHKLSDQAKKASRKARQLDQQIEGLQRRIKAPFTYRPQPVLTAKKAGKASRFVPAAPKKVIKAIPEDALPAVGALRKYKGRRYLVIDDWIDLEQGEAEAARLNAELVTRERA